MNDSKLSMNLISREELKEKLDRGDKFKLVNALGEWAFNAKHIPGSINISKIEDARKILDPNDDIVIYCSNPSCIASIIGYPLFPPLLAKEIKKNSIKRIRI
jgi:rhodanese-related sulfurtransferase